MTPYFNLNYTCYENSYFKTHSSFAAAIGKLLLLRKNTIAPQPLVGTKWKLVGLADTLTNDIKALEPQNCEECYTLTFHTDTTFGGQIVYNTMSMLFNRYEINYTTGTFHISRILITSMGCPYDEDLYTQILKETQSFTLRDTLLHLYYNDGKNYLKFELHPKSLCPTFGVFL
ncbi:MAG: META domain-containing protein [Prevotellaceae bacterium]|jgi:hypothetical protein|nr:META domain-containing protein [Prevotellaceae bacterium]